MIKKVRTGQKLTLTLFCFSFSPIHEKHWCWNIGDVIWNLLKLQKNKEKPDFSHGFQWIGHYPRHLPSNGVTGYSTKCTPDPRRYINWDSYPPFKTNLAIFAWFVEKGQWFYVKVSVYLLSKNLLMGFPTSNSKLCWSQTVWASPMKFFMKKW